MHRWSKAMAVNKGTPDNFPPKFKSYSDRANNGCFFKDLKGKCSNLNVLRVLHGA